MSDLSALEQRRLANISRNEAFLSELGLEVSHGSHVKKTKKNIKKRKQNENNEVVSDNIRFFLRTDSFVCSHFAFLF